jgi:hypothetical protein
MKPIISSKEEKIKILETRKKELLLRKKLLTNTTEIKHVEKLIEDVEDLLRKYKQPTTMRKRIRKTDEE